MILKGLTMGVLKGAIDKAKAGDREKMEAIRRLRDFTKVPQRAYCLKLFALSAMPAYSR